MKNWLKLYYITYMSIKYIDIECPYIFTSHMYCQLTPSGYFDYHAKCRNVQEADHKDKLRK